MDAKALERILILRTIINGGGEMAGKDIADCASVECDHDLLESLPPLSRRGIRQKLQAMEHDGLVTSRLNEARVLSERVSLWSATEMGHELAASIGDDPTRETGHIPVGETRDTGPLDDETRTELVRMLAAIVAGGTPEEIQSYREHGWPPVVVDLLGRDGEVEELSAHVDLLVNVLRDAQ